MANITELFAYDWLCEDVDGEIRIHIFGASRGEESEIQHVVATGFNPYCYIELPRNMIWDKTRVDRLIKQFKYETRYANCRPDGSQLVFEKDLYFARCEINPNETDPSKKLSRRTFPYLRCWFSCDRARMTFANTINRTTEYGSLGRFRLVVNEARGTPPELQLQALRRLPSSGWIKIVGDAKPNLYERLTGHGGQPIPSISVNWMQLEPILNDTAYPNVRFVTIDVEAYSSNPNRMPQSTHPDDHAFQVGIVSGRVHDAESEWQRTIITMKNCDDGVQSACNDILEDDTKFNHPVQVFDGLSERGVLTKYAELIREISPVIICGYNTLGWDFEYLFDRSKMTNCARSHTEQSPIDGHHTLELTEIKWSSAARQVNFYKFTKQPGRIFLDLLPLIRTNYKLDRYNLDTAAREIIGTNKMDLPYKKMFNYFADGSPDKMSEISKYCIQDAFITTQLMNRLHWWIQLCEMSAISHTSFFDFYTRGQQVRMYNLLYCTCIDRGIVIQHGKMKPRETDMYRGAIVIVPSDNKVHDNVATLDYKSLYPATLIVFNLCYSTLVPDDENIPDEFCDTFEWADHLGCSHDEERKTRDAKYRKNPLCEIRRFRFLKKEYQVGIMPEVTSGLLNQRDIVKKRMKEAKRLADLTGEKRYKIDAIVYDAQQKGLKIIANSGYGITGVKAGRLPCMPVAMTITREARRFLKDAAYLLTGTCRGDPDLHANVQAVEPIVNGTLIYGDTDSVMVKFPGTEFESGNIDVDAYTKFCLEMEKKVNVYFELPMYLEFEDFCRRFLVLTRKRYFKQTYNKDGTICDKLSSKGVLLQRRDNCQANRDIYGRTVKQIMADLSWEDAQQIVADMVLDIFRFRYPLKDFIITKSIRGSPDEYKAKKLSSDPKQRSIQLAKKETTDERMWLLRSLQAHVYLSEKLKRRGELVEGGQRLPYVITLTGGHDAGQWKRIEDPRYFRDLGLQKLDHVYYIELLENSMIQLLNAAYDEKAGKWFHQFVRLHQFRLDLMEDIRECFRPNIVFSNPSKPNIVFSHNQLATRPLPQNKRVVRRAKPCIVEEE